MVTEIPLTQGKYALVDEDLFDWLNQWKWYANYNKSLKGFYAQRHDDKKVLRMHRVIMEKISGRKLNPQEVVDHINHNSLDNTIKNLRVVSQRQNMQNINKKYKTTSKYPGIYWDKSRNKWRAQIWAKNKKITLGRFSSEKEAAKAYEKAVRELCGEELVCKMEN